MRGSPLLRSLAVVAALLLTGLGLAKLTAPGGQQVIISPPAVEMSAARVAKFDLLLSGTAKRITMSAGGAVVTSTDRAGQFSGKLEIPAARPTVFLEIEWSDISTGHRFAKLRVEIPGEETREHVFNAPGDIDDVWEP